MHDTHLAVCPVYDQNKYFFYKKNKKKIITFLQV